MPIAARELTRNRRSRRPVRRSAAHHRRSARRRACVFDHVVGDLFVVCVAGHSESTVAAEIIEYGVAAVGVSDVDTRRVRFVD